MPVLLRYLNKIFIVTGIAIVSCQPAQGQAAKQSRSNLDYIDPTIGNVAPLLNPNRPVVQLPNQMVRVFPKREDHLDMQITDFPMLATNIITPQMLFAIRPSRGEVLDTGWYRRLNYDHDFEVTKPWYYSVMLTDDNIVTEFTAGKKTGIYRFRFPAGVQKNLLLSHYYPGGGFELRDGNVVEGREQVNDVIHSQKGVAYLYGVFSGKPKTGTRDGEKNWGSITVLARTPKPVPMEGKRAWASYGADDPNTVEFRYAISFISVDQAKKSFREELTGVSFEQLENKGKAAWKKVAGQVNVEGGTEAQKRTFYTALYRCYARMVDISEDGNYFSGYDKKVHADKRPFYTDDYSWGNYIALHPLRVILDPEEKRICCSPMYACTNRMGGCRNTRAIMATVRGCLLFIPPLCFWMLIVRAYGILMLLKPWKEISKMRNRPRCFRAVTDRRGHWKIFITPTDIILRCILARRKRILLRC